MKHKVKIAVSNGGKKITKQAMHNRWNKIITKACKYFGVEKPKQAHKQGG